MLVLIAGSREAPEDIFDYFYALCSSLIKLDDPVLGEEFIIISGGARGADSIAKELAQDLEIDFQEYPANWDTYGKSAGYRRNAEMVARCDKAYILWDGESRGTAHTIDLLETAKIPHIIYRFK